MAVEEADERDPPLARFHQRLVPAHALFQLSSRSTVQVDYVGFNTGNGEKLSYSKATDLACSAWL